MKQISSAVARVREEEDCLTDRELEVLGLLATGLGTAAIAKDLSISSTTVRNHVQRIITKLKVHSRLAAVAIGHSRGLIRWESRRGEG